MTCKCGSTRIMQVNGKCSDLSSTYIPHLDFEHEGYMPGYGVGSGDYVEFSVCLDCGQVQDWEPFTDEMIKESEEWQMKHPEDEDDEENEADPSEPDVISLVYIEKQRISKIMAYTFGELWMTDPKARSILQDAMVDPMGEDATRQAAKELL